MKIFYGVRLESNKLSTAFDVIRYLAEPDHLRFSHITLRGPYARALPEATLHELNHGRARHWRVRLDGPSSFFEGKQNTVIIRVHLLDLNDLVYKPDFEDGVPHLTLYDGRDRPFAAALLGLLFRFDFHEIVTVTALGRLHSKKPVAGDFGLLYQDFYQAYCAYIGAEPSEVYVRALSSAEKIAFIEKILLDNFTPLITKLNQIDNKPIQQNLSFDFDDPIS